MSALTSQAIAAAGTTPATLTPTASDTIAVNEFGPNGCLLRAITSGSASNITVVDPGKTPMGNGGSAQAVACPATGARMIPIPRSAIDPNTQVATVTSSSQTGLTYELYRY